MLTKWVIPNVNDISSETLSNETGYARFVCDVLANRGFDAINKLETLRAEDGRQVLQDPMSFHGMNEAVARIQGAIWMGEKICIYGDYDCDGVTATTLLVTCLRGLGADVSFYIPNRFAEGYGMNEGALRRLAEDGVELVVTVDNGISAVKEVEYAKSLGMDVVVTDHHSIPDGPLPCVPTINPHLPECPSQFKEIAGVGVAFYLACALTNMAPTELLETYGDILALGSVADVMPLIDDNRIFVQKGLELLRKKKKRPGIAALMEVAGIEEKSLSARTFGFSFGPRINAAGRMDDATIAVDMLLTDDYEFASTIAAELDVMNVERKKIEEEIMKEIGDIFSTFPEILQNRIIVVSGSGWHQGVIGIVAARLVELYGKPSIVLAEKDGEAHGSGRSIDGISLIDAIRACKDHLVKFGGHKQAAGLTIKAGKIDAFRTMIDHYSVIKYPVMPIPNVRVDAVVEAEDLSVSNAKALSVLEPFGEGNPSPQFVILGATVVDFDSLSQGKHIKVHFKKNQKTFSALYFQMAPSDFPYRENDKVDVLVQMEVGEYRGAEQLSVFIRGIKPAGFVVEDVLVGYEAYNRHLRNMYDAGYSKDELLPSRDDIAATFRLIRERGMTPTSPELVTVALGAMTYQKTLIAFDVMTELGFIQAQNGSYVLSDVATKRNLDDSQILKRLSA